MIDDADIAEGLPLEFPKAPEPAVEQSQPAPVMLTEDERALLSAIQKAMNEGKFYPELASHIDELRSIAHKEPRLLIQLLKDAKVANVEHGGARLLTDVDYGRYKNHFIAALRAVGYEAFKKDPHALTKEERQFIGKLQAALDSDEVYAGLASDNHLLRRIAKKQPDLLKDILKNANTNEDVSEVIYEQTARHINAALKAEEGVAGHKLWKKPRASGFKRYLQGILTGAVITGLGGAGGAVYLAEDSQARNTASTWTAKAGFPLSPEDQVRATLADPDAMQRLADHFGGEEGVKELKDRLESGDSDKKADALLKLSEAMKTALKDVAASQEHASPKLQSLGR